MGLCLCEEHNTGKTPCKYGPVFAPYLHDWTLYGINTVQKRVRIYMAFFLCNIITIISYVHKLHIIMIIAFAYILYIYIVAMYVNIRIVKPLQCSLHWLYTIMYVSYTHICIYDLFSIITAPIINNMLTMCYKFLSKACCLNS